MALDPGLAVEDHEELGARGALADDDLARRTVTCSADFATSCSSFLEQAEKRGTVASASTNESLRAMRRNLCHRLVKCRGNVLEPTPKVDTSDTQAF